MSGSDSSSEYSQGSFPGSDEDWYHGEVSRPKAEQLIMATPYNCFLIRQSKGVTNGGLVLSLKYGPRLSHIRIVYGPGERTGWYKLNGSTEVFTGLLDLVNYYRRMPISNDPLIMLGLACPMAKGNGQKRKGEKSSMLMPIHQLWLSTSNVITYLTDFPTHNFYNLRPPFRNELELPVKSKLPAFVYC